MGFFLSVLPYWALCLLSITVRKLYCQHLHHSLSLLFLCRSHLLLYPPCYPLVQKNNQNKTLSVYRGCFPFLYRNSLRLWKIVDYKIMFLQNTFCDESCWAQWKVWVQFSVADTCTAPPLHHSITPPACRLLLLSQPPRKVFVAWKLRNASRYEHLLYIL